MTLRTASYHRSRRHGKPRARELAADGQPKTGLEGSSRRHFACDVECAAREPEDRGSMTLQIRRSADIHMRATDLARIYASLTDRAAYFTGIFLVVRPDFHARWCSLTAPKKGAFDDTFGNSDRSAGRLCNACSRASNENRDVQRQRFRRAWATDPSVSGRHDPEGCSSREEEEELGVLTLNNSFELAAADSDKPSCLKAPPRRGFLLHQPETSTPATCRVVRAPRPTLAALRSPLAQQLEPERTKPIRVC